MLKFEAMTGYLHGINCTTSLFQLFNGSYPKLSFYRSNGARQKPHALPFGHIQFLVTMP